MTDPLDPIVLRHRDLEHIALIRSASASHPARSRFTATFEWRVHGTPGTVEFLANLERICRAAKLDRTSERSFAYLAREYRRLVNYTDLALRTRQEYDRHIERYLMPVFGAVPVTDV